MNQKKVLGVIVYYNPEGDFLSRLKSILNQVDELILFDNGDEININIALQQLDCSKVVYHSENENKGIAFALNFARNHAIVHGFTFLATFDQDSIIKENFINELSFFLEDNNNISIVSPIYKDINSGEESAFPVKNGNFISRKKLSKMKILVDVFCTITSGSLCRVTSLESIGEFRDDYFIDYVDNEYCLRALTKGFRVCVAPSVIMEHALGERKKIDKLITITPTNYSPLRKYYMTRNRINVYKHYFLKFPFFVLYDALAFIYDLARIVCFESNRVSKVKAVLFGIYDALTSKYGKSERVF